VYQKIVLIGNLGKDPTMRYTPSGTAVTNFSVATTANISKEKTPECPSGWVESYNGKAWSLTTWWNVSCWRSLAETCNQYLEKGKQIYIEGEVNGTAVDGTQRVRTWEAKDGSTRASFDITARLVKFLGGRDSGNGGNTTQEEPPASYQEEADPIPF
jgi:single-strand DNA-binding protein